MLQQKLVSEASQLLKAQESLDKDLADHGEYFGLSLNETIYRLVRAGYGKRAQKLQSEFKMPEKAFWWLRLRALVAKRDWGELEEIGKVKKSPIGWEVRLENSYLFLVHADASGYSLSITRSLAPETQSLPRFSSRSARIFLAPTG